jgi:dTMP kinase
MGLQWIVFEAGDGAGKSTQVEMLYDYYCENRNITPKICRQPGETKLGEVLRTILLSPKYSDHLCAEAERLLFAADNAQFIEEIIAPILDDDDNDNIIIQDRYTPYSNYAYGVYGSQIVEPEFMELLNVATKGYYPDLVFLLDLDPEVAQKRIQKRGSNSKTRIDNLDINFHKRVREGYLKLSEMYSDKFRVIDASKNTKLIHEEILSVLKKEEELRGD